MSAIKFRWVYIVMIILALSAIFFSFLNPDSFDVTAVHLFFVPFPLFVSISRRFITFWEAYWYLDPPIRGPWKELFYWYIDAKLCLGLVISVALFIISYVLQDIKGSLSHGVCLVFALSFTVALVEMLMFGFDDSEENEHLKDNQSIGACWAIGAFKAYYEIVFDDIVKRMSVFEKEHDIKFCTKKFILLAPMSCNVRKTLDRDCESNIEVFGELESLEHDQGANINRIYKNTVYKITEDFDEFYIVGGFASSLNTLWPLRDVAEASDKSKRPIGRMNNLEWKYHRDCFIKNLEPLVRDYPCIFLKYDDKNTEKSLSAFLKSELLKRGFGSFHRD